MKAVTNSTFQQDVLDSQRVVLLDAWAPWCGPCRAMEPLLEQVAEEIKSWADVVKLNVDEEGELAQNLGVSAMPTFMVFKGGQMVASSVGASSKASLIDLVNQAK